MYKGQFKPLLCKHNDSSVGQNKSIDSTWSIWRQWTSTRVA